MSEQLQFDGSVAVITGAGRGLGRQHALALASRGAQVVVNDLGGSVGGENASSGPADEVVAEINASGGSAIASYNDASDPKGGAELIEAALDAFGRVDIIIANAGIMIPPRPFEETELSVFERMWRVHFGGMFNVIRAGWPHLVEQRYGRIVTTTSPAAFAGATRSLEYASAKGAILSFTRSLALDAAKEHEGIKVNGLAPLGLTRMLTDFAVLDEAAMRAMEVLVAPELVTPGVVWLAHERCPCNGAILEAGAGRYAQLALGMPAGYWPTERSAEELDAHAAEVRSTNDLTYIDGSEEYAEWIITRAADAAANRAAR